MLFLSWRSSDEEGDPLAPSAFLDDVRALFTDDLWDERGTRLLADVTWAPRDAPTPHELRRAYAAAAAEPEPAPLGAPATGAVLGLLAAPRDRAGARARGVRRLRRALADRAAPAPGPHRARPRADAARLDRARGARAHARAAARAHRLGADRARAARRRARRAPRTRCASAPAGWAAPRVAARARAAARAGGRPGALSAHRGRVRRRLRADGAGVVVRRRGRRPRAARAGGEGGDGHRPRRPRRRRPGRRGGRARLQGPHRRRRRRSGPTSCSSRSRSTCSPCATCSGSSRSPASTSRSSAAGSARAGSSATTSPARYTRTDLVDDDGFAAALEDARELAERTAAELHAGRIAPVPGALLEPRLPLSRASAAPASRARRRRA